VLERRRHEGAPLVVALLPLSDEADAPALWARLHAALAGSAGGALPPPSQQQQQQHGRGGDAMEVEAAAAAVVGDDPEALTAALGLRPHTAVLHGRSRLRVTLLPPPQPGARGDPMGAVELGRCADVLLLVMPGGERALPVDPEGELALRVLRALGLPTCVGVVVSSSGAGAGAGAAAGMKERSAAKRRAEKALAPHLPGGELRLFPGDSGADAAALLRHLADAAPAVPLWRRGRAAVMVHEAAFQLDGHDAAAGGQQQQQGQQQHHQQGQQGEQQQHDGGGGAGGGAAGSAAGTLRLTGYVRGAGLSANQLVTVPGAGDFQLLAIEGPADPAGCAPGRVGGGKAGAARDAEMGDAAAGGGARVLAAPEPAQQDSLVRENVPDAMGGEQTWPTDEELRDAELAAAAAAKARRRRKLPPGTSDYQAAWIFDDMSGGESDEEEEEEEEAGEAGEAREEGEEEGGGGGGGMEEDGGGSGGGGLRFDEEGAGEDLEHLAADDPGTEGGMALDEDSDEDEEAARARNRAMREEMKRQRQVRWREGGAARAGAGPGAGPGMLRAGSVFSLQWGLGLRGSPSVWFIGPPPRLPALVVAFPQLAPFPALFFLSADAAAVKVGRVKRQTSSPQRRDPAPAVPPHPSPSSFSPLQAEAEDMDFPDEVDVPDDKPARERFARYRGLKSLRSSPWDPREGTPADYERVFAFENFKRTHKRAKEAAVRGRARGEAGPGRAGPGRAGPGRAGRGLLPWRRIQGACTTPRSLAPVITSPLAASLPLPPLLAPPPAPRAGARDGGH
jgi:hypothetical protein